MSKQCNHVDDRDRDTDQERGDQPTVCEVTLPRVLRGLELGRLEMISCSRCRRDLITGMVVQAYVYRSDHPDDDFSVAELACGRCEQPKQLVAPTLGLQEALIEARLAVRSDIRGQTHRLVLVDVDVLAFSPADED
jgi:hypothetical protein